MSVNSELIKRQLDFTVDNLELSQFGKVSKGKVRDSIILNGERVLAATDRISCFDVVLSTIPFKGEVLTKLALFWFEKTSHLAKNHIIKKIHPQVLLVKECKIIPIEVVVRGYLTGSAWRGYQKGEEISGIKLPVGLKQYHKFETPLFTPSTKAKFGEHDLPISEKEIVNENILCFAA